MLLGLADLFLGYADPRLCSSSPTRTLLLTLPSSLDAIVSPLVACVSVVPRTARLLTLSSVTTCSSSTWKRRCVLLYLAGVLPLMFGSPLQWCLLLLRRHNNVEEFHANTLLEGVLPKGNRSL